MDVSSSKIIGSFPPDITAHLVVVLAALQEIAPEGCSVMMNVSPLLPTKTALVFTPNKTLWLTPLGTILEVEPSTSQEFNVTCVESLPKQPE
jgi:hypothetical protein